MNQSMRSKKYVGVWGVFLAALLYTLVTDAAAQPDNAKEGENSEDWVKLYEPNVYNEMPYRLMKPIDFDPKKRYPIIVSLHGGAGRGTDNRKQLRPWTRPLAEEQMRTDYPSYVLAPQVSRMWDAENLQKIKDLVAELPSVDMDRIYALGHSMGGTGSICSCKLIPVISWPYHLLQGQVGPRLKNLSMRL